MSRAVGAWLACVGVTMLSGCGGSTESGAAEVPERRVAITSAVVETRPVRVIERTLGRLEARALPAIAAETAGRVQATLVDVGVPVIAGQVLAEIDDQRQRLAIESAEATIRRLEALLANQRRLVERLTRLAAEKNAPETVLEEAEAQARALAAQISAAEAARKRAARDLSETRVRSPLDGIIQQRHVSNGDYVAVGQAMFEVVQQDVLRAYLPYPEGVAETIRPGMRVRLGAAAGTQEAVESTVKEMRPVIGRSSRSVEAIVEFPNPGRWRAGGTVVGEVVIVERQEGRVVPEASVVLRPAGSVVYRIASGRAVEVPVKTGVVREGWVELLEGPAVGVTVARDGAGFLTDGVAVDVRSEAT